MHHPEQLGETERGRTAAVPGAVLGPPQPFAPEKRPLACRAFTDETLAMQYFAYGSNLCVPRLEKRGADPKNGRVAFLADYELLFNKASADGSSKANIMNRPGASGVWGVVFDISDTKLCGLRGAEGWPLHYGEQTLIVSAAGAPLEVTAYVALPDRIIEGRHPYGWYLNHIVKGAARFGLPSDYVTALERCPFIDDTSQVRHGKEMDFWA